MPAQHLLQSSISKFDERNLDVMRKIFLGEQIRYTLLARNQ